MANGSRPVLAIVACGLILLVGLTQFMPSAVVYNSLLRWYYHVAL